ncbi:hypothetical protein I4641_14560 [Waterburya agarophytonicola K14]|uniref:Uncharacterized protein n=1 Tax=Waterburya agarophytonicola KI4 TaxID=2874699 RepID=A0A964BTZ9_9CYAN|nr:hypothetical protein [Waterburya agarophytonicola]MCC0178201.1 hypothetical protein [Waterburya agarophytonicola KI4]
MNRYYLLLLINLIGLSVLLITKSAIALNTFSEPGIKAIASCDGVIHSSLPFINDSKDRTKIEKDLKAINRRNTNADIPQESIWWAAEQFDPFDGNLIQNWLTYPQKQQINLTVNWQLWTLLDYFGRYRFVNQFGTVVRKHGYSLNIFNQKKQCLATYKYNSVSNPPKWELYLETFGRDSLELEFQENIQDDFNYE